MTTEQTMQVLMPIFSALAYSTLFYGKKYLDPQNQQSLKETFDLPKFAVTQAIGLGIAGLMMFMGQPITMAGMLELFLLYEGVIVSADQALKAALRGNEKVARSHMRDAATEGAETTAGVYYSSELNTVNEEEERRFESQEEETKEEVVRDGP